jgi:hypothetical protein
MEQYSGLDSKGQIKDALKWFIPDKTFTRLNVDNFKKYGKIANKSISSLAEEIKVSRPKLYQHEALISDKDVRERLIPLVIISDLAYEAFAKNEEKTIRWVMDANHLFFGRSPFEMALGGKSESVIQTLNEWLGK